MLIIILNQLPLFQDEFLQDEEKMQILEVWKVFDKKGENQVNAADLPTIFQVSACFFPFWIRRY